MPTGKQILLGRTLEELTDLVTSLGMPRFTGKQIAQWLYDKRVTSIDEMTNLSKANRALLSEQYTVGRTAPVMSQLSQDGTRKYLFQVATGGLIEAVFIPDKDRATLCISSQVGCKMDCLFCMTGKQGFKGNLSTGEIINQVLSVEESLSLTNIVYMGMGEPLDNAVNVMKSIEVMTASWGLAWSPKRITLSTVGVRRGLERFLSETTCHLAVSLHNPFHGGRLELMPAEGGLPLVDTLQMIREADFTGQRRVSFEYIVFDGVNDSEEHAAELARLLRGIPCRINLIPFHQIPNVPLRPLAREKMEHFKNLLEARGYTTTIRTSRGEDISAACGMLSTKEQMARNTSAN
nr:23S rRNA (adenine(2503)-C(2))-methyltransferase RlmN [uncultured Porphyromonas sp.]